MRTAATLIATTLAAIGFVGVVIGIVTGLQTYFASGTRGLHFRTARDRVVRNGEITATVTIRVMGPRTLHEAQVRVWGLPDSPDLDDPIPAFDCNSEPITVEFGIPVSKTNTVDEVWCGILWLSARRWPFYFATHGSRTQVWGGDEESPGYQIWHWKLLSTIRHWRYTGRWEDARGPSRLRPRGDRTIP